MCQLLALACMISGSPYVHETGSACRQLHCFSRSHTLDCLESLGSYAMGMHGHMAHLRVADVRVGLVTLFKGLLTEEVER